MSSNSINPDEHGEPRDNDNDDLSDEILSTPVDDLPVEQRPTIELTSQNDDSAASSTDQNRMDLPDDYEPGSYSLSIESEGIAEPPSWQTVERVETGRSELAADSIKTRRRKRNDFWVLLGCNAIVFLSSVCVMVLELTASRLIAKHVGSSLYTWTSVIGVVLAGITLGNFLGGWLADRFKREKLLAQLFFYASVSCLSVLWLDQLVGGERPEGTDWPTWVFFTVAQMFLLPAMALGTISPVVASIALSKSKRTGITVGNVYAWGALGSIIGTFLTGFYLIDLMGTRAIIGSTSAMLAVLGAIVSSHRLVFRMFVVCGWLQFVTTITLAAAATPETIEQFTESLANVVIDRDEVLEEIQAWYEGDSSVLPRSLADALREKSKAGKIQGISLSDRSQLETWTKSGERKHLDQQVKDALAISFRAIEEADEKHERWKDHGNLLGSTLHELGILLFLRDDAVGEYHDESNYSYINVSEAIDETTGDLTKQLRLDKLAHSYINLAEPTKLYYEYEQIYAELTQRAATNWQVASTIEVPPFPGLNRIVEKLPNWASYDAGDDILTVTGSLTDERRKQLIRLARYGDFWLALEKLGESTRATFWGGFSSMPLDALPSEISNVQLLKEKLSFDENFKVLNVFRELSESDVDRLCQLGDASKSTIWRKSINQLFAKSLSLKTFFIGGGGFVFPRWIEHHYPNDSRIDVAELDPAVKLAVQEAMGLPEDEFTLVNTLIGDARNVVDDLIVLNKRRQKAGSQSSGKGDAQRHPATKYDFIYGDAFNDLSVPWHLTTREFNQKVKSLLHEEHGVYMINVIDIWPRAEFPIVNSEQAPDDTPTDQATAAAGLIDDGDRYDIVTLKGDVPDEWRVKYDDLEEWQPLRNTELAGCESLANDAGKFRIGFRGLMTTKVRDKLLKLTPATAEYKRAIDSVFEQSQKPKAPGQFLSACVNTLSQDFPNVYVFSTQHGPPSDVRDTFVIVAALKPMDFSGIENGEFWDTAPFATLEKSDSGKVTKTGQIDALLSTSRGLVLTDDYAPVDRLLRPVFVDQE